MKILHIEELQECQKIQDAWIYIGKKVEKYNDELVRNGYRFVVTSPFVFTREYVDPTTFEKTIGPCRKKYSLMIRKIRNEGPYRWITASANVPVKY
jgi:hypothetical protein